MLADVPTVDGRAWTKQRIEFLEGELAKDPPVEQRLAIETELEELRRSSKRGLLGWLLPGRLPHQH